MSLFPRSLEGSRRTSGLHLGFVAILSGVPSLICSFVSCPETAPAPPPSTSLVFLHTSFGPWVPPFPAFSGLGTILLALDLKSPQQRPFNSYQPTPTLVPELSLCLACHWQLWWGQV